MNNFQKEVKEFTKKKKMDSPIEYRMLDLVSELGEVAKEICKMSNYGKDDPKLRKEIALELGDAFYSLITVANYYNVDLEEALKIVLAKYEDRIKREGHAGSKW